MILKTSLNLSARASPHLVPPSQGTYDEVIQTADESGQQQWLGLVPAFLARYEDLSTGGRFREGVFAVLFLDEIFPEWNQEEDAQYTTQQGADEHLHEVDGHFRIFFLKNVKGRQGKDGSRYNHARAGTDGLDDDVFSQGAFPLGGA